MLGYVFPWRLTNSKRYENPSTGSLRRIKFQPFQRQAHSSYSRTCTFHHSALILVFDHLGLLSLLSGEMLWFRLRFIFAPSYAVGRKEGAEVMSQTLHCESVAHRLSMACVHCFDRLPQVFGAIKA